MSETYNPFKTAQNEFTRIADMLGLEEGVRELLFQSTREYSFSIPIRMDNGEIKAFRGYRVHHNDARGLLKGGIRLHPQSTVDTIRALAMWLTWKSAVADIPLGGANGCIVCDPHDLSLAEQERLCRGYVRQLVNVLGPDSDVPAPDVMANAQHMLWMLDEYEALTGKKAPAAFTGKPIAMGGSLGRTEATGYGVVFTIREALKELGIRPEDTTASIQGFGAVGRHAFSLYQQLGGKVVSVGCYDHKDKKPYTFRKKSGADFFELKEITDNFGNIDKEKAVELGYEVLDGDKWIEQDVDILIPAALENQINKDSVSKISKTVKLIAEGANGPTTPDADKVLREQKIFVIPDFLANCGGVVCSYFEYVQSKMNYYWDKDEVLGKLDVKMTSAFISVSEFARKKKLYMRDAAYIIAIDRVATAVKNRGWV